MLVTPIAHTLIDWNRVNSRLGQTRFAQQASHEFDVEDMDHLGELAGRACYKSWDRQNPATATTGEYLKRNILGKGHFSVLEHASVTFLIEGVSRSMLLELERHRFLSFSVESQRYVNQAASHREPVVPPAFAAAPANGPYTALMQHYANSVDLYEQAVSYLMTTGLEVKQAREAARSFLPNATPVDFVVTGNLRCWRDVIGKRYHMTADAEIRQFASEVLTHLRELAPLSVQDIPEVPFA